MNRDLYHPLTIGAIIIWIIMAFSFSVPLILFIPFLSLTFSIYRLNPNKFSIYLLIISIAIFIGFIGNYRVELINHRYFLPENNLNNFKADIRVIKDSVPTKAGFITSAEIISVTTPQSEFNALETLTIFSKEEIYAGVFLSGLKVKKGEKGYVASYIGREDAVYISHYYRLRGLILKRLKINRCSPLLIALITGNRAGLSSKQVTLFRECGCSHILALSGFHVGIITILIMSLLRIIFTGNKIYIISIVVLIIYLTFVGFTPSLLRSVFMYITAICIKMRRMKLSVFRILIISYYITIVFVPEDFYSLSFKLSYLALAGIVTIGEEIKNLPLINQSPIFIQMPISASIAAMIATTPICFPLFGSLYPIGIIASVLLTPVITIFIWSGLLSLLFPKLLFIVNYIEDFIYFLLSYFSNSPVIDNSFLISPFITLIAMVIPVILVLIKLYRRVNAGRFNLKFKL